MIDLEHAAADLVFLDRFEQRLEVALAEAVVAAALDDLEEQRRTVLHRRGEDLKEVPFLVGIDQDSELGQRVDRLCQILNRPLPKAVVFVEGTQAIAYRRWNERIDGIIGMNTQDIAALLEKLDERT